MGAVIGGVAAVAATRMLRSLLVGIAPTDTVSFAAGVTLLFAVAFAAALTPALIATKVDPMVALRYE